MGQGPFDPGSFNFEGPLVHGPLGLGPFGFGPLVQGPLALYRSPVVIYGLFFMNKVLTQKNKDIEKYLWLAKHEYSPCIANATQLRSAPFKGLYIGFDSLWQISYTNASFQHVIKET